MVFMKKILLSTLGIALVSAMCSCNNSGIRYNNDDNTTTVTDASIESKTYKICYSGTVLTIAVYDEEGNLIPNAIQEIRYLAGHDYDLSVFGDFTKNNFYCLGDSIKVTYDKSKTKEYAFPYEVISVEKFCTATVERVSLDDIVRNEDGGILSIGGKTTKYSQYAAWDAIYITDKSLKYDYLSAYKGDVLYRATDPSEGYVYYSFDPTK
jgi:hypothetical protein